MILPALIAVLACFAVASPSHAVLFDNGIYEIYDNPDGNAAPPTYGLRLDGVYSLNTNDVYTFEFDYPGTAMLMDYQGTSVRIYGTAYGGLNLGSGYADPGYWDIDMTYTMMPRPNSPMRVAISTNLGSNTGTIQRQGSLDVIDLVDFGGPPSFILGFGHRRSGDVLSGWGWLNHSGEEHIYASDWHFTVGDRIDPQPICELALNKTCCIPRPLSPGADQCEGKVVRMAFEYVDDDCSGTTNTQGGKAMCSGGAPGEPVDVAITKDADTIFATPDMDIFTDPGVPSIFEISGTEGQLKASTKFAVIGPDDTQLLTIHSSCSKPLSCGDQFGSVRLIELETTEGGVVNCLDPLQEEETEMSACVAPNFPEGTSCDGNVSEVVFEYVGADCAVLLDNPQGGKAECSGDATGAANVSIIYTGKDPAKITLSPAANINDEDVVRVTATGTDKLKASTKLLIQDAGGALQALQIHTSCSKTLALGDVFGSLRLIEFTEEGGAVKALGDPGDPIFLDQCEAPLGAQVEFQYTVTNHSDEDAMVTVADPSGPIASGEMVTGGGGTRTFFSTRTLFETLTHEATVTGAMTPSGGVCDAVTDELTITVSLPPFDCKDAKPIDALTMKWAGLQNVCVRAYDGAGGGILLDTVDNVAPTDLITIGGMGGSPNDQEWEIYAAGDCGGTLLGISQFHISCSDSDMNGIEDCGKNLGDGKNDDPTLVNDWLLEEIKGDETLDCTPDPIVLPGQTFCGLGFELAFLLPPLLWLYGRRKRAAA